MTCDELNAFFPSAQVICLDRTYGCPKAEWVTGKLVPYFKRRLLVARIFGWKTSFDCNRYANAFKLAGDVLHANSPADDFESLAIGVYCFIKLDGERHAINVIVTKTGPFFIEPQTCQKVILTTAEKQSAWLVLFV